MGKILITKHTIMEGILGARRLQSHIEIFKNTWSKVICIVE